MRFSGLAVATSALGLAVATPAMSAAVVTSASVTGPSGTVWDTTVNGYYTLFVHFPLATSLNPNDEALSAPINTLGNSDYAIFGDGWPLDTKLGNSDLSYTLNLLLQDGVSSGALSGVFTPLAGTFVPTTSSIQLGTTIYTLTDFAWSRTLSNIVGAYNEGITTPLSTGSTADYAGAFTLTTTAAVPEPAAWAMMTVGFGLVGSAIRRRKTAPKAAIA